MRLQKSRPRGVLTALWRWLDAIAFEYIGHGTASYLVTNICKSALDACVAPGRPEEFHLQPPTEPYVTLASYTARTSHALAGSRPQDDAESHMLLPVTWLTGLATS